MNILSHVLNMSRMIKIYPAGHCSVLQLYPCFVWNEKCDFVFQWPSDWSQARGEWWEQIFLEKTKGQHACCPSPGTAINPFMVEMELLWDSVHVAFKEVQKIELLQVSACQMLLTWLKPKPYWGKWRSNIRAICTVCRIVVIQLIIVTWSGVHECCGMHDGIWRPFSYRPLTAGTGGEIVFAG